MHRTSMLARPWPLLLLLLPATATAQLNVGGTPPSWEHEWLLTSEKTLPDLRLPEVDVGAYQAEDAADLTPRPWRFGAKLPVDLGNHDAGQWETLPDGARLWRLPIRSPGALSLNLIFDTFVLPPGGRLFVYSEDRSVLLGAYTEQNHQPSRVFATSLIPGDAIVLEYVEPLDAAFPGALHLASVTHGYRDLLGYTKLLGDSGSCNNNVACPEALGWEDQIRSVGMLVSGGDGFCTGALINNSNQDGTPYFLTANHCYSDPAAWIFWFNWESATCSNPGVSPPHDTLSGAQLRARRTDSDFCLVELNNAPPASFSPFYAGWNNGTTPPTASVGIHHPSGDIKKISFDNDPAFPAAYGGGALDHWQVDDWDDGTTEGGSSGSPLFDQNHRIIGQLHGGGAACGNNLEDLYGRLDVSWDGAGASSRLRDWLDPTASGATTLDGLDPWTPTVSLDAQVLLTAPADGLITCGTGIDPAVILRNRGSTTLTSVDLVVRIDGVVVETYPWTGSLATNGSVAITLAPQAVSAGAHTLLVTATAPNGGTDGNPANDAATVGFSRITVGGQGLPFTEDFEAATFPPTGWSLSNPDGSYTWELSTAAGSAGSTNSATLNNYDYNSTGAVDELETPYLDLGGVGAPIALTFDLAYARYSDTLWDSLGVNVSTDCGATWTQVYFESSTALATAPDLQAYYTPAANEWRTETIDLSAYAGEPHLLLSFENTTGYGNWLYVDAINLSGTPTGDVDGDGFTVAGGDCDDTRDTVYPNAPELCDLLDNDCDSTVDEGLPTSDYWPDVDGDTFGDAAATPIVACSAPAGRVGNAGDCDDSAIAIHPNATEVCDLVDNDCDASTDEGVTTDYWPDSDGDTFGSDAATPTAACSAPAGMVADGTDCDDVRSDTYPGAPELCDGLDNDCDPTTSEGALADYWPDSDGDGYGESGAAPTPSCSPTAGMVADDTDCDDTRDVVYPNAPELCDLLDNDCDGSADEGLPTSDYWPDVDGDTFGDQSAAATTACAQPAGMVANDGDCLDSSIAIHPNATEVCDLIDNDCDASTDEGLPTTDFWPDADGDGFGDQGAAPTATCLTPAGMVTNGTDCQDTDGAIFPGATEVCDTVDNDCDASTDEGVTTDYWPDADADGHGDAGAAPTAACAEPAGFVADASDCLDTDGAVHPGAFEACDTVDNDCDGATDEGLPTTRFWPDLDGDAYGDIQGTPIEACLAPPDTAPNFGDCDDGDGAIHPRADELCDEIDNDCDGGTDEDLPMSRYWPDADEDGRGDAASLPTVTCAAALPGMIDNADDCDDTEAGVHLGAEELTCNARDDDCDPSTLDDPEGTCSGPIDGGADAGPRITAGRGCACDAGADDPTGGLLALLVLGLLPLSRRRRG